MVAAPPSHEQPSVGTDSTRVTKPSSLSLDDVPRWLGWLAVPSAVFVPLVGLAIYCYWSYWRGRRDGIGRQPTREPVQGEDFWKVVIALAVVVIIPLVGLLAVVALPTMCYKQGLRVGAKKGTVPTSVGDFGSITSLAISFAVVFGLMLGAIWLLAPSGSAQESSSRRTAPFTDFTNFGPTQSEIDHCKTATAGYATGLMLDDEITPLAAMQLTNELGRDCSANPQGTVEALCSEIARTDLIAAWKRAYCR